MTIRQRLFLPVTVLEGATTATFTQTRAGGGDHRTYWGLQRVSNGRPDHQFPDTFIDFVEPFELGRRHSHWHSDFNRTGPRPVEPPHCRTARASASTVSDGARHITPSRITTNPLGETPR